MTTSTVYQLIAKHQHDGADIEHTLATYIHVINGDLTAKNITIEHALTVADIRVKNNLNVARDLDISENGSLSLHGTSKMNSKNIPQPIATVNNNYCDPRRLQYNESVMILGEHVKTDGFVLAQIDVVAVGNDTPPEVQATVQSGYNRAVASCDGASKHPHSHLRNTSICLPAIAGRSISMNVNATYGPRESVWHVNFFWMPIGAADELPECHFQSHRHWETGETTGQPSEDTEQAQP